VGKKINDKKQNFLMIIIIHTIVTLLFLIYSSVQGYKLTFHTKETLSGINPSLMSKEAQEFWCRIGGFVSMIVSPIAFVLVLIRLIEFLIN